MGHQPSLKTIESFVEQQILQLMTASNGTYPPEVDEQITAVVKTISLMWHISLCTQSSASEMIASYNDMHKLFRQIKDA